MLVSRCGKQHGPRHSRISAAVPWTGVASLHGLTQLCQNPRSQFHRPHSPHHHPHRRLHHRPHHRAHCHPRVRYHQGQWTHSIAQWMQKTLGQLTRKSGAAESTTADAHPQRRRRLDRCPFSQSCHQHQWSPPAQRTHTIVLMDLRIGRQDGVCRKRSGAAGFMARVAPVKLQVGVPLWEPPLRHTIAMPGSLIGWRGGVYPRKPGAARMLERAALQQQEDVLELDLLADLTRVERWHSCAIFWCLGPVLYARCVDLQRLA